jgi:hypothetical protein
VLAACVLVARNAKLFHDNQRRLAWDERLGFRGTSSLRELSARSRHPAVRNRLAFYYLLADRAAGAHVTIPPSLSEHRVALQQLASMRVEIAPSELVLASPRAEALAAQAVASGRLDDKPIDFLFHAADDDYVLARGADGGRLLWLPLRHYRAAGGAMDGAGITDTP